jgi:hypothetical protein
MTTKLMKRLIMGAVLVFAVIFLLDRPLPSFGNENPDEEALHIKRPYHAQEGDSLETIAVGVYVISFDELNLTESYYVMTFYLSFTCEIECSPEGFEFTNGTIENQDLLIDEPDYKSYKMQVTFRENFDVRRFPFDSHTLNVIIEDSARQTNELVYVVDEAKTDIAPDVIISGWDLDAGSGAVVDEHDYRPNFEETYSRYNLSIAITRPWLSTIFKALLPVVFIIMVAYSQLWLGVERAGDTFEIISGALIGAILHHLYLSGLIPPTGYMTLMDAFMSVAYMALVLILFILIWITNLVDADNRALASRAHKAVIWLVPLILLALESAVFLLWLFVF